ncbi:uncharacterized protein M421DRAFT_214790 [Didymella exigua CBS 183.55]|uniref:Uncharacterized protein n=1 Tax=Didymella exigua CBS 183.55 TaxID=1150837 RepID=A0A6A5RF80_9PLEO|nr:uncharacterized protein M421DRAFT_214790 [Didymella exigua CBS 183.55]KAF1926362.1 hypothetical protein M421DRAFT_214790 [Didymella exigua CBS 183.55]
MNESVGTLALAFTGTGIPQAGILYIGLFEASRWLHLDSSSACGCSVMNSIGPFLVYNILCSLKSIFTYFFSSYDLIRHVIVRLWR